MVRTRTTEHRGAKKLSPTHSKDRRQSASKTTHIRKKKNERRRNLALQTPKNLTATTRLRPGKKKAGNRGKDGEVEVCSMTPCAQSVPMRAMNGKEKRKARGMGEGPGGCHSKTIPPLQTRKPRERRTGREPPRARHLSKIVVAPLPA